MALGGKRNCHGMLRNFYGRQTQDQSRRLTYSTPTRKAKKMARYRLRSAHFLPGDKLLMGDVENAYLGDERGTIVGTGTEHEVKWPTLEMIPLDEEAEAAIEKEHSRIAANNTVMNPLDNLPLNEGAYENDYVPGFNTRRRPAKPDGATMGEAKP